MFPISTSADQSVEPFCINYLSAVVHINALRRVLCLTSAPLRFGLPRLRDADPELSQEELASSLQSEAHVRLADEHDRAERWWTQASLPILCQFIVDPTLFGDELLYLLGALHLSRLYTPSEHC